MKSTAESSEVRTLRAILFPVFVMALSGVGGSGWAQVSPTAVHIDSLGRVSFPTSCAPHVQSEIEEGVALLHSFQYREAESTFSHVAEEEPHCAMAYWGKAMSLYQQLWGWPNARAFDKGREDAETAEKEPGVTQRERAYIDVARVFYQNDQSRSHGERMETFSKAWQKVYQEFPNDIDAGAFYGLSLVSLAEAGIDETSNRAKAIAVLDPLFRAAPKNPGPAHYLIHAADTPALAPLALNAARKYAIIAPDSAHALHMPSHIFVRMGLWQESIESNRASAKAAARAAEAGRADIRYQVHAMDFLDYSYLQAGDEAAAREVTADLKNVAGASVGQIANYRADFQARAALELHRWKEAESLIPAGQPRSEENTYWARAIGAARTGDAVEAQMDLAKLEQVGATLDGRSPEVDTHINEARAWITFAQGKAEDAVRLLRATVDVENVESLSMPAHEMLADMLLESRRAPEALHEYELTLHEAPNRFDALYGAARAAEFAGKPDTARKYFAMLIAISIPSADRIELQEAKTFLASK